MPLSDEENRKMAADIARLLQVIEGNGSEGLNERFDNVWEELKAIRALATKYHWMKIISALAVGAAVGAGIELSVLTNVLGLLGN